MKKLPGQKIISVYDQLTEKQQEAVSEFVLQQLNDALPGEKVRKQKGKNQTHKAIGRLLFEYETVKGKVKPLHNMYVELWDRDIGNPDDFLGSGMTDLEGNFEIWYDPADAGMMDLPDLDLRVFEKRHTIDAAGNDTILGI
jgi:hypothetical protein